jgi:hypothetical protein
LFVGNTRLFSNVKIIQFFIESLQNKIKQERTFKILEELAERGQSLPDPILLKLTTFLNSREAKNYIVEAIRILNKVAINGQPLPEEILLQLTAIVMDPALHYPYTLEAIQALIELANSSHPLSEEHNPN